jgi:hypothetical protein
MWTCFLDGLMFSPPQLSLFNLTWQSAFLALGQIWANKVRALLTTIGIVIGVASSRRHRGAERAEEHVLDEIRRLRHQQDLHQPRLVAVVVRTNVDDISIRPRELEGCSSTARRSRRFTRMIGDSKTIAYGTKTEKDAERHGIDPSWHDIENRPVLIGPPFSLVDNEQGRAGLPGRREDRQKTSACRATRPARTSVGGRRYTIVGVVKSRNDSGMFGRRGPTRSVIPLRTRAPAAARPAIYVVADVPLAGV